MNSEELNRQNADAVFAHLQNKSIQVKHKEFEGWMDTDFINWNFVDCDYRPKPELKTRPWGPDDVPVLCWIKGPNCRYLVTGVYSDGVRTVGGTLDWETIQKHWNFSTDLKSWAKCEVAL